MISNELNVLYPDLYFKPYFTSSGGELHNIPDIIFSENVSFLKRYTFEHKYKIQNKNPKRSIQPPKTLSFLCRKFSVSQV